MGNRPWFIKIARPFYRLLRPFIPHAQRYYRAYQNYKLMGLYHQGAVSLEDSCFVDTELDYQPLISIVVPVYNPDPVHFLKMVYSVINQHYQNWELILANASSQTKSREHTARCSEIDTRIKIIEIEDNKGISGNTNKAIQEASGEYVAFGDHDDLLHPCALHSVVEALQANERPQLVYTDEDKISDDGARYLNPHIKPDWSMDTLRNVNFVTHLVVIEKALLDKVKGLRSETDGSQDYDLLLRVWDESKPLIKHVNRVLYHWRLAPGSTAELVSNKQYIIKAGTKALRDHLKRNQLNASASHIQGKPGYYEVQYQPVEFSIIVGPVSPDRESACAAWVDNLEDDGIREIIVGDWYAKFRHNSDRNVKILKSDGNYWQEAVKKSSSGITVCFKAAALPIKQRGLSTLAAAAADPEHTAVSPMIVNKTGIILGGGIVDVGGLPKRLFEGYQYGKYTWFLDTDWVRKVDDLTTEVVAARTDNLRAVFKSGHYDERATFKPSDRKPHSENYVVWSHSPFELLGDLSPSKNTGYQLMEPFRFVPATKAHVINWWKDYERDEP